MPNSILGNQKHTTTTKERGTFYQSQTCLKKRMPGVTNRKHSISDDMSASLSAWTPGDTLNEGETQKKTLDRSA